jgi:maltooligosyltrehalose trehalohydrolase
MGQEWAASTPFQFFTDHEPDLGRAIAEGRRAEFAAFAAFADPGARQWIPDPQAEETFTRSRLRWEERAEGRHGRVLDLYRRLIRLRRTDPVWRSAGRAALAAEAWGSVLAVHRWSDHGQRLLLCNLGPDPAALQTLPASHWRRFTTDRPDPTILIASGDLPPDLRTLPPHTAVVLA